MLPQTTNTDRIQTILFDDHRLVRLNVRRVKLDCPATLARHLGLRELRYRPSP